MKIKLTIFFSLFTVLLLNGQTTVFTTGTAVDPHALYTHFLQTPDGGFIHCTSAEDTLQLMPFVYLVKYDTIGNVQWSRRFPISDHPGALLNTAAITRASDCGYLVATTFSHWIASINTERHYACLVKTDSVGSLMWTRWYPVLGKSTAYGICETADRGFAVCGITRDTNMVSPLRAFVFRTDSVGTQLWAQAYDDSIGNEYFYTIQEATSGDLLVYGAIYKSGLFLRLDSSGAVLTAEISNATRRFVGGVETPSGNVVAFGSNPLQNHSSLYEITPAGAVVWSKQYHYGGNFTGASITGSPGGYTMISNNGDNTHNVRLAHVDFNGNTIWAKEYADVNGPTNPCLVYTNDNGYCFAGEFTTGNSSQDNSIIVVKTDSSGVSDCNVISLADFTQPPAPLIATTFVRTNAMAHVDVTTHVSPVQLVGVPYCLPTIIDAPNDPVNSFQVYPNPADDRVNIEFSDLSGQCLRIRLYDALGQVVRDSETERQYGSVNYVMDLTGLASGLYVLKVEADGVPVITRSVVRTPD